MAQTPHVTIVDSNGNVNSSTAPFYTSSSRIPAGTDVTSSATGANAAITATLPGAAGKTTRISGFEVTGTGATSATIVTVTVTGLVSGTLNYVVAIPAGIQTSITPLLVTFPREVAASAENTAIVVNVPAFGLGNTNVAVSAHGYQL